METLPESSDAQEARLRCQLESLFADAHGELLGTLFYCVGNLEDARDALQETFLKCWRNREQIDSVDNLRAWVFRIALNTGRDCRKTVWSRRRQSLAEEPEMISTTETPESRLVRDEQLQALRNGVQRLRDEERDVFLLRQNGELTYEQIASALALPLGTVKTRMRNALSQLRQAVGDLS